MGKNKNKKKPTATFSPNVDKMPLIAASPVAVGKVPTAIQVPWVGDFPSWRIAKLELIDPYGWHEIAAGKLLDIQHKLACYESMTWSEILKDRDYNHHVAVNRIADDARQRLEKIGLGMLDQLFRLRLTGKERIWGYRVNAVLHVIWWDPQHLICPSHKKHT